MSTPATWGRALAYGLPGLPLAALLLPLYVYLPSFYAEDMGLGLAAVGTVLLVARLWDMGTDPVVGYFSDHIRTRFGRRRLLMAAGAPVLLVSTWALFVPPEGAGPLYLLVTSMGAYLGLTLVLLPFSAWGAELSNDYDGRTSLAAGREGFTLAGTLIGVGVPAALGLTGGDALELIALGLLIVLPACLFVTFIAVPEPPAHRQTLPPLSQGVRVLARNRPFVKLLVAYVLNGCANGLPATLFLLYVKHVLQVPDMSGLLLLIYFGCGAASVPLWVWISKRTGKKPAWIGSMIWAAVIFAFVPLLGPGDVGWYIAIVVATGIGLGADLALPASMQADVIDLDRVETGTERAGLYFSLWGMATKLALALAVGIAFPLLDLAGFAPEAEANGPQALTALALLYAFGPSLLKLAAVAVIWTYPIDAAAQAEIRARLADEASAQNA
ncbi:MAG: MFS transporter [Alphaproteobacteria bacterium]|nr:MFS transporter [Alphaproteobacteria bacterium]MDX5369816.1 MFS transporter [Alphaproteobacteria bacterium]MDX5464440.1 MFS transporter [Alphaproteobacteria bacterium]